MDINFKKTVASISEAYESMLSEGKVAKFAVGDKVGIGSFGNYGYHPNDTGTVTKVNGHGHHTVEWDTRKNSDDPEKPYSEVYDADGRSRKQYGSTVLVAHADHAKTIADRTDRAERAEDLNKIVDHISGLRNGYGHFSKLDKTAADHLKSLIDKHTEV